jgi:hypothetical protein
MNVSDKLTSLGFTVLLYIVHFGINWGIYRYNWKEALDDLRKFSIRFALVGVSLFMSALMNPSSTFYTLCASTSGRELALVVAFSILLFVIFDGFTIWFSKTYEKRPKGQKAKTQVWKLVLSHVLGAVTLCVGLLLT